MVRGTGQFENKKSIKQGGHFRGVCLNLKAGPQQKSYLRSMFKRKIASSKKTSWERFVMNNGNKDPNELVYKITSGRIKAHTPFCLLEKNSGRATRQPTWRHYDMADDARKSRGDSGASVHPINSNAWVHSAHKGDDFKIPELMDDQEG